MGIICDRNIGKDKMRKRNAGRNAKAVPQMVIKRGIA